MSPLLMMRMSTSKHVPQRSCIACRRVAAKQELIRIVATPQGVLVDGTGRLNGRGAYICRTADCWEAALKKNRLGHALKAGLSEQDRERVCQYISELKGSDTGIGTG